MSDGSDERVDVEHVLAVPREVLVSRGLLTQGFARASFTALLDAIAQDGAFLPRDAAEEDSTWKQIIPYAVVRHGELVFRTRRSSKGGEARLHDRLSIGIGGHINDVGDGGDLRGDASGIVERGLRRELDEELVFVEAPRAIEGIGLLNDDSNAVGRVHLGLVSLVEAASTAVSVRETEVLEGGYVSIETLLADAAGLETWSQIVAESLFAPERA